MNRTYSSEMRERALRILAEARPEHPTMMSAMVRAPRRSRCEGDRFERGHVAGIADRESQSGFGDSTPGDDRACGGGDVDVDSVGAEPLLDDHLRRGKLRRGRSTGSRASRSTPASWRCVPR